MNFFLTWLLFVEPIFGKAMAIIPHIKEIINIAFKPYNGTGDLEETDENNLKNGILFINSKFKYLNKEEVQPHFLDSEKRKAIILLYGKYVDDLEKQLLKDVIVPAMEHYLSRGSMQYDIGSNRFIQFYFEEMTHSLLLSEGSFYINPVKESLIRCMEKGLDYFVQMHPGRRCGGVLRSTHYFFDKTVKKENNYGNFRENFEVTPALELIGLLAHLCNSMGMKSNCVLRQFKYIGLGSTYELAFPITSKRLVAGNKENLLMLEDVFNKIIIQGSIVMKLIKTSSLLDSELNEFYFPSGIVSFEIKESETLRDQVLRQLWSEGTTSSPAARIFSHFIGS